MIPASELPADGLHEGVPFADYLAWPAVSRSGVLEPMRRSPAYYKATKGTDNRTPAKNLGSALNDLALQPHLFPDRFILTTKCVARTGKGEPCTSNGSIVIDGLCYCGKHADKGDATKGGPMLLTPEQHALAVAMAEAIQASPEASAFLKAAPGREVSMLWTDPHTKLRCKGRLDICGESDPFVYRAGDLKMSRAAHPAEFSREANKFGYHRQAAWYLTGLRALGIVCDEFTDIAVANTVPHEVYVYDLIQDAVMLGQEQNRAALDLYHECVQTNRWPGGGRFPLSLPAWAMGQNDDDNEDGADDGATEVA
jgi:hypothetical protein